MFSFFYRLIIVGIAYFNSFSMSASQEEQAFQAVISNDERALRTYLDLPNILTIENNESDSLLHSCARLSRFNLTKMLIAKGVNPLKLNQNRKRADQLVPGKGKTYRVLKSNLYEKLIDAIDHNRIPFIESYLNTEVETNEFVDDRGNTLLHLAAAKHRFTIVNLLINSGFDSTKINNEGQKAIDLSHENSKTYRYLLFQELKPFHKDLHPRVFHLTSLDYILSLGYTGRGMKIALSDEGGVDFSNDLQNKSLAGGGYIGADSIIESADSYQGRSHAFKMAKTITKTAIDAKILPLIGHSTIHLLQTLSEEKGIKFVSMSLQDLKFSHIYRGEARPLSDFDVLWVIIAGNCKKNTRKTTKLNQNYSTRGLESIGNNTLITVSISEDGQNLMPKSRACSENLQNVCLAIPGARDGTTSPTAAFITAGAAVLRQAFPTANALDIQRALLETAQENNILSKGTVDFKQAFFYLKAQGFELVSP